MDNTLEQLKESWRLMEEEEKDPSFCYMLYIAPEDETDFADMQEELKLDGELIKSGEFHATVRYVKTDKNYDKFLKYLESLKLPKLTAECVGFAIYGKDKDTLVIELESKEMQSWFDKVNAWLVENDYPKSDFPTYKPHISLTEKAGIEKPEWKDEYKKKVTFKIHVVTNTYYEEVFRDVV
jgi:hypothetical protein